MRFTLKPWTIALGASIAVHAIVLQILTWHSPLVISLNSNNTAQHKGLLSSPTITFVSSTPVKKSSAKDSRQDSKSVFFKAIASKENITRTYVSQKLSNMQQAAKKIGKNPKNFLDKATQLKLEAPELLYPVEALERQEQGTVILKGFINTKGDMVAVKVIKSSASNDLDRAAINWFKQLKFLPTYKSELKTNRFVIQKVNFNLKLD